MRTKTGVRCDKCGDFLSFAKRRRLHRGLTCKCGYTTLAGFKKPARLHRTAQDREVTEGFFRSLGSPVESRIEQQANSARQVIRLLKRTPKSKENHAAAAWWAIEALGGCITLDQAPPKDLIDLITLLLGCGNRRRHGLRPQNTIKWHQAAKFLARNPAASNRLIERQVGVDHTVVARWKREPAFQKRISFYAILNLPA
jgi:hypothetical protein